MIVKCINNNRLSLPENIRNFAYGYSSNETLPITQGKEYIVSAIQNNRFGRFYLIITDDGEFNAQPFWIPENLFDIIDKKKPKSWIKKDMFGSEVEGFHEIVEDDGTFDNALNDGQEQAMQVFLNHFREYIKLHKNNYHGLKY